MNHVTIVHCNSICRIGNQTTDSSGAVRCYDEMVTDEMKTETEYQTETLLPQTETFHHTETLNEPLNSVVSTSIPLIVGLKRKWKLGELLLRNVLFVNIV